MALEILGRVEEGSAHAVVLDLRFESLLGICLKNLRESKLVRESIVCRGSKALESYSLYSWNSAQCYVASRMGGEFRGEWTHVHILMSPFYVHLKQSQHF